MSFTPYLTSLLLFEILAIVVMGSLFVVLAIYAVRESRFTERSRIAAKENPADKVVRSMPETGFYYLRAGRLRNSIDMKVRLYSLEEYGRDLGRTSEASRSGGFVVALKAYGYHVDHWYEMPCGQTISNLGLQAEEYEVDGDRGALLLRKLPDGLPARAREKLDQPKDLRKNVR